MKKIVLNKNELKLIIDSIEFHKNLSNDNAPEYDIEIFALLKNQLKRIEEITIKLTDFEINAIIGSLRNFVLNKNDEIIEKNSYEIIMTQNKETLEKIDLVCLTYNVLSKLDRKSYLKFNEKRYLMKNIHKSENVYYSKSRNGDFYKIAINLGQKKGIRIENNLLNNRLEIINIIDDTFMSSTSLENFLKIFKEYYTDKKISETGQKIINLIEKASV